MINIYTFKKQRKKKHLLSILCIELGYVLLILDFYILTWVKTTQELDLTLCLTLMRHQDLIISAMIISAVIF